MFIQRKKVGGRERYRKGLNRRGRRSINEKANLKPREWPWIL